MPETARHENDWSLDGVAGLPDGGKLDLTALGLPTLSMRVRTGRNLKVRDAGCGDGRVRGCGGAGWV